MRRPKPPLREKSGASAQAISPCSRWRRARRSSEPPAARRAAEPSPTSVDGGPEGRRTSITLCMRACQEGWTYAHFIAPSARLVARLPRNRSIGNAWEPRHIPHAAYHVVTGWVFPLLADVDSPLARAYPAPICSNVGKITVSSGGSAMVGFACAASEERMRMTAGLVFFLPSQQHTRAEDVVAKCVLPGLRFTPACVGAWGRCAAACAFGRRLRFTPACVGTISNR